MCVCVCVCVCIFWCKRRYFAACPAVQRETFWIDRLLQGYGSTLPTVNTALEGLLSLPGHQISHLIYFNVIWCDAIWYDMPCYAEFWCDVMWLRSVSALCCEMMMIQCCRVFKLLAIQIRNKDWFEHGNKGVVQERSGLLERLEWCYIY